MQLSRKTLPTPFPVIKLKVTPSDHPFKKTKWFCQNISFQNYTMEDKAAKTSKECLQHLNVPYAKLIVETIT